MIAVINWVRYFRFGESGVGSRESGVGSRESGVGVTKLTVPYKYQKRYIKVEG
ncbi:hypothetical protein [Moorena sp. SIOASIH]|uniref:hypothetical protein n=1 Tax=Moorena sp. SIOASIH TaxID=2607817 RepID=UPI0025F8B4CD|nr:hypothetical protein [Moorena sp. SIOASIH]